MSIVPDGNVYYSFEKAIQAYLLSFDGGSMANQTVMENESREILSPSDLHLRIKIGHVPPSQLGASVDSLYSHRSVVTVGVMAPLGSGSVIAAKTAGDLVSHFNRGTELTKDGYVFKIESSYRGEALDSLDDSIWYQIPVTIEFSFYSKR